MQILLLENIKNVGKKHTVVKVPDGYANNNLIPKKLAIPANSAHAKDILAKAKSKQEGESKQEQKLIEQLRAIDSITIEVNTNTTGSLYQSISEKDIAEALKTQNNITVSKTNITLTNGPIKELGEHTAAIQIGEEKLKINILITTK